MALDFDALRKKLNTLQGQNNRSTATWKPAEGKTIIRIIPWKGNPDFPFIELLFHYLGGKTQLSPMTAGKPDPIAEFADKLRSTNSKDDWELARNFTPKQRTFVPVIVRGEEDKGVRFWGFGKTVYKELATIMNDGDYGDITHPKTGRDITVTFTPKKPGSDAFAKTEILVKPNVTPATDDAETLKRWLTTQPDINEIFVAPTYEELESFLERYLAPESDTSVTATAKAPVVSEEDSETEETTAPVATAVKAAPAPKSEKPKKAEPAKEKPSADAVADEFDKLFNES